MLNQGSCEERLSKARHVLEVLTQHPEAAALLGINGPDRAELARGWALYRAAEAAWTQRTIQKAEMLAAMARCAARFESARTAQARLTALARVMITNPSDRDRLGLSGRRAEALGTWRLQAELFHINLTPEDHTTLRRVGITHAELAASKAMLNQLADHHAACTAAKARAKAATAAKDTAFADLAAFLSVLIGIARALEPDHPDLIKTLNMKPDGRRRLKAPYAAPQPTPEPLPTITIQSPAPQNPKHHPRKNKSKRRNRRKNSE